MIIIVSIYTFINLFSADYFIAYKNINRYYKTKKIDIWYLQNYSADNISLLIDLYEKTDDMDLKNVIYHYINEVHDNYKIDSFQEYNISKKYALDKIGKQYKNE